jgi:hypothetical protein
MKRSESRFIGAELLRWGLLHGKIACKKGLKFGAFLG